MIIVDKRKALRLLDKVVKESGANHCVYACTYVNTYLNNNSNCIVGKVLIDHLNVPASFFTELVVPSVLNPNYKTSRQEVGFINLLHDLRKEFDIHFTKGAIDVLHVAQCVQDDRICHFLTAPESLKSPARKVDVKVISHDRTWGNALKTAQRV